MEITPGSDLKEQLRIVTVYWYLQVIITGRNKIVIKVIITYNKKKKNYIPEVAWFRCAASVEDRHHRGRNKIVSWIYRVY